MIKESVAGLQKQIDVLTSETYAKIQTLQLLLLEKKRKSLIVCQACRKRSALSAWSFIQGFWHTPPRGCSGGDYWNRNEVQHCYIACPKCEKENRIYNHPQKDKIVDLVGSGVHTKVELFDNVSDRYKE